MWPNLFVNMLQRMCLETDDFASSTGTLCGLEMVWLSAEPGNRIPRHE
jgi:hypothetical protein